MFISFFILKGNFLYLRIQNYINRNTNNYIMYHIHALNIEGNPVVAVAENWYVGEPPEYKLEGFRIDETKFDRAEVRIRLRGVFLGKNEGYQPVAVGYNSRGFLVFGAYVNMHTVKPPSEEMSFGIPPKALTIIANDEESLREVAKELYLPLEEIVASDP